MKHPFYQDWQTGKLSRQALQEFEKEGQREPEILADATLVRALLAQNKLSEAQKEVDSSKDLLAKSQNFWNRSNFAIVSARTGLAVGKIAEARLGLEDTLAKATKRHCLPYQLEARLALGELKMNSGEITAGRALLASLEKDATGKGFLLIARKARAASDRRSAGTKKPVQPRPIAIQVPSESWCPPVTYLLGHAARETS